MDLKFYIYGGGDPSAGILDVEAEITINDNVYADIDDLLIEDWKDLLAEFYDIPKKIILTEEELNEKEKLEEKMYKKYKSSEEDIK